MYWGFVAILIHSLVLIFLSDIVNFLLVDGLSEEAQIGRTLLLTVIVKNSIPMLGALFMLACGLYFLLLPRLSFQLDFLTPTSFETKPSDQKLLGVVLPLIALLMIVAIMYQVFTVITLMP